MIQHFNIVIGMEVHVVLNSKTKMFSPSKNCHYDSPNSNISPIDLGHPGIMPLPNETCISKGVLLAHALKMDISKIITFDRKNYFYPDLPKGFQITQNYHPIGRNGKLKIIDNDFVEIERIHLEEDTAKQSIEGDKVYLDYNRSGLPLIEIVTTPTIKNAQQAGHFLRKLRKILVLNNISDAKLEDGSMRVDVNVSINHKLDNKFGTRVEIKNINSITNVEKAINYEVNRQLSLILSNIPVKQETRKFNDKLFITEFMREKSNAVDYHYMIEPNIFKRSIDDNFILNSIENKYIDVDNLENELSNNNISSEFINLILDDWKMFNAFNTINSIVNNHFESAKWLCVELIGIISKDNIDIGDISNEKISRIGNMIDMLLKNKINGKQAKEILKLIYTTDNNLEKIIDENGFKQINDEKIINQILMNAIESNKSMLDQYSTRPERVEKFFIGIVMKETKGQANPDITFNLLKRILINNK